MSLAKVLELTRPFIVLDFETTGKDPATARICQIGMRIHRPDGSLKTWKSLVLPDILMPKEAEETHHISNEILRMGCSQCWLRAEEHPHEKCAEFKPVPRFIDLADNLLKGWSDADFGGYHIHYDLRVAAEEFDRLGKEFDYSGACVIDSLRLEQLLEPRRLSDVYEKYTGEKLLDAHDALVDVEGTEVVLIRQLTEHPRADTLPRNLRELHDLQWPKDPNQLGQEGKFQYVDGVLTFTFGKHKGKPVAREMGYVRWMLTGGFSPEVRKICDRLLSGELPLRKGAG